MGYYARCNGEIEFSDSAHAGIFTKTFRQKNCCDCYVHDTLFVVNGFENYHEEKWGSLLTEYAEFFVSGIITFSGEDDEIWRFVIETGKWHKEIAVITWEVV